MIFKTKMMNKKDHLNFFCRIYILKGLYSPKEHMIIIYLYESVLNFYKNLIETNIDFDVENLNYEFLTKIKNKNIKKLIKKEEQENLEALISSLKYIYSLNNYIKSQYRNIEATFNVEDLTLKLNKDNIEFVFKIEDGYIRYVSYNSMNENYLIKENFFFEVNKFDIFVDNIMKYYKIEKPILDILIY